MKVLITGGKGQLGSELKEQLRHSYAVWNPGKSELDITQKETVESIITSYHPEMIIHAAAFTAVDHCETDRKKAFEVNGIGTSYVVSAAKKVNARVIYISTDYVFDGKKRIPYTEDDEPNPQTIYGLSKWMGEKFVQNYENGTIVRTSWLYGHSGKNFVKTMLQLAKTKKEIKVVNDQIGTPTYVNDLVQIIIQLFEKENGLYHVSNTGSCSWYEFARHIFMLSGYDSNIVLPITTEEYHSMTPRPKYSVLDLRKLKRKEIKPLRPWFEALKEFLRKEFSND